MRPKIEHTSFGSITIDGRSYAHDVVIRLSGQVEGRQKELSQALYGSSHTISLAEVESIYNAGAKALVIGTGQYGKVHLSQEAAEFLSEHDCQVDLRPTPQALTAWNEAGEASIGLFHVTC